MLFPHVYQTMLVVDRATQGRPYGASLRELVAVAARDGDMVRMGTMHSRLQRLQRRGLVRIYTVRGQDAGQLLHRRRYALTGAGRAAMTDGRP